MQSLTVGGKTVEVTSKRGSVAGLAARGDPRVSGRGGANNSDIEITSTVVVKKEFHIQPGDGSAQLPVQLTGLDIPLMDGQDVSMLMATAQGTNFKFFARLVNHSNQRSYPLINGAELATKLSLMPIQPAWALLPWGVGLLLPWNGAGTWGFLVMLAALAWLTLSRRAIGNRLDRQLDDMARALVKDTASESPAIERAAAVSSDQGTSQGNGLVIGDTTSVPTLPLQPAAALEIGPSTGGTQPQAVKSQIKGLEKCLVIADLPGAAAIIGDLHRIEAELDADTKKNINQLEAIFLSLVHARLEKLKSDTTIKAPETARERYEARATEWIEGGRSPDLLAGPSTLMTMRCWTYSDGGKKDGASDGLREFIAASEQAQRPNWLDAQMDGRAGCRACGESFRVENLAICTHCMRNYCYGCKGKDGLAANGNAACACGGELVG